MPSKIWQDSSLLGGNQKLFKTLCQAPLTPDKVNLLHELIEGWVDDR